MILGKEHRRMKKDDIEELMTLKGWSRTQLAAALDLTENTVHRWMFGDRKPSGPASILMRMWLTDAKSQLLDGQGRKRKAAV